MYKFICARGHVGHSEAQDPLGGCAERGCEESPYLIVTAEEAHAQGCRSQDCTRFVKLDGRELCLHLRTGVAYPYDALRALERRNLRGHLRSC